MDGGDDVSRRTDGHVRRLLLSEDQLEDDVRTELAFHVEGRVAELVEQGWAEADARAEVLRRFGDLDSIRDKCVEIGRERIQRQRRIRILSGVWTDVKYAARTFAKNPVFTSVVLLTLALGIGATTAVFTVVDHVAIRSLPFPQAERLVVVWESNPTQGITADNPSPPNLYDWREQNRSFDGLAAWMEVSATLTGRDRPEVLDVAATTANFFEVLGIAPMRGRGFSPQDEDAGSSEDPGTAPVAVLSHQAWRNHFGGGEVLGTTVQLSGSPVQIVGIMPEGFTTPRPAVDMYVPSRLANPNGHRQTRSLNVIGRLASGVSMEQAERDMKRIALRLSERYPDSNAGWTVSLVSAMDQVLGDTRQVLLIILASVGFVLLIACANVANLQLGRAAARSRELGVRSALGASAARLRRQMITESLLLGAAGGVLGLVLAHQGVRLFLSLGTGVPRMDEVSIDLRILAFAVLISMATALLFGILPALRVGRLQVSNALGDAAGRGISEGRRGDRTRRFLVVAEVALSLMLLVGAGLFLRSFMALRSVDPGFEQAGVVTAKVSLGTNDYPDNEARRQYFERLQEAVEAVPGVHRAALTSTLPMDPAGTDFDLARVPEGHPMVPEGEASQTDYRIVSPGYFESMGIGLVQGRDFNGFDRPETTPVIVVTESLARSFWPGEDPIGKHVLIYYVTDKEWEVVGVVEDTRHHGLATPERHQMFVPVAQAEYLFGYMTLAARIEAVDDPPLDAIRDAAIGIDPNEPLFDLQTMDQLVARSLAQDRFITVSFGVFALLAVLLASAGIYGVISYQVARRTQEIGVRIALGASRAAVVGRVLGEALGLALAGALIGTVGAIIGTRVARSFLFGVTPFDPLVLVAVPTLLLSVTVLAALAPARRAASIDPALAMRSD
jgi:putative ABC transport system permease protein